MFFSELVKRDLSFEERVVLAMYKKHGEDFLFDVDGESINIIISK